MNIIPGTHPECCVCHLPPIIQPEEHNLSPNRCTDGTIPARSHRARRLESILTALIGSVWKVVTQKSLFIFFPNILTSITENEQNFRFAEHNKQYVGDFPQELVSLVHWEWFIIIRFPSRITIPGISLRSSITLIGHERLCW